jgi:hypothetical protein
MNGCDSFPVGKERRQPVFSIESFARRWDRQLKRLPIVSAVICRERIAAEYKQPTMRLVREANGERD